MIGREGERQRRMIDITRIFSENNDQNNNRYESSISSRNVIRAEIQNTRMRNDFYRYLSWRIQTAPLKKKIMHTYKNFYITTFTIESWILIESFIEYAVEMFNNSHSLTQRTTVNSTTKVLEEWWDYDYEEYLWDEEVEPEQEQEEDQIQTVEEEYLAINNRKEQKNSEQNISRYYQG